MNTRTMCFAVLMLTAAGSYSSARAAAFQDGAEYGYDLGSGGGVDTDNIFQFCPDNAPTCVPANFLVTAVIINYSNFGSFGNGIAVSLDVFENIGSTLVHNDISCGGPLAPGGGRTGNDFLCILPSAILMTPATQYQFFSSSSTSLIVRGNNELFTPNPGDPFNFTPSSTQGRVTTILTDEVFVPEPATISLFAAGLGGLLMRRRKLQVT